MRTVERIATALVKHRRVAIPVLLAVLLTVGAGATQLQQADGLQSFEVGTEEEATLEYVESNFSTGPANQTVAQVVVRDENVLDRETLLATLELQQTIRENGTVAPTLRPDRPTVGVANLVARAAVRQRFPDVDPTLDQQTRALAAMNASQVDAVVSRVLSDRGPSSDALALMSTDYEPGSTNASATMVAVFQTTESVSAATNAPEAVVDSQLAVRELARESGAGDETLAVGNGLITAEQRQSRQDTMSLLGPLALLLVLVTLAVVYRDLVDVLLSLAGIVAVQVWTFGTLGWLGIAFNPVLIAVPILLVGLSIDYGIHVFMRYRERRARSDDEGAATAMRTALAGVGVALLWVTVTTVVGFLSNLVSPVDPIRELGLISAVGIVGALFVFGLLFPPLRVAVDGLLERVGFDRTGRPVGTGGGRTATLLSVGSAAARKVPVIVLALALVVTLLATAGASQVSTSFDPEDNIVEETPAWTEHLPEEVQPANYTVREDLRYVNEHFVRQNSQVEFLVEGNVTDPGTLEAIHRAETAATDASVTVTLANGQARTQSPLAVMERVAARNEAFERSFAAADTDGDGVPDGNLTALYDRLFAVAPDRAASVLHREGGDYVAARMAVSVNAEATGETTVRQMREVAGVLEGDTREATATGRPVVNELIQDHLLGTLLTSLLVTLVAVLALLAVVYRLVHGSATLGVVTLVPVLLVVTWVIGTMYVLGYPLSVLTTLVASITVGIGIDYSIHLSERFRAELEDQSVEAAVTTATRETGSALLGSAVTTAAGFGILGFAFFPVLQQFGTITAVMTGYAFLASVLVLPSLLVLWARYVGVEGSTTGRPAAATPAEALDD